MRILLLRSPRPPQMPGIIPSTKPSGPEEELGNAPRTAGHPVVIEVEVKVENLCLFRRRHPSHQATNQTTRKTLIIQTILIIQTTRTTQTILTTQTIRMIRRLNPPRIILLRPQRVHRVPPTARAPAHPARVGLLAIRQYLFALL